MLNMLTVSSQEYRQIFFLCNKPILHQLKNWTKHFKFASLFLILVYINLKNIKYKLMVCFQVMYYTERTPYIYLIAKLTCKQLYVTLKPNRSAFGVFWSVKIFLFNFLIPTFNLIVVLENSIISSYQMDLLLAFFSTYHLLCCKSKKNPWCVRKSVKQKRILCNRF